MYIYIYINIYIYVDIYIYIDINIYIYTACLTDPCPICRCFEPLHLTIVPDFSIAWELHTAMNDLYSIETY